MLVIFGLFIGGLILLDGILIIALDDILAIFTISTIFNISGSALEELWLVILFQVVYWLISDH